MTSTYKVKGIGLDYKGAELLPKIGRFTLFFGAVHDIYPRLLFYYAPIASFFSLAVTFKIVISTTPQLSWMSFPLFLLLIVGGSVLGIFFVWFITIPQNYYYGNWQSLRNGNVTTKMMLEKFEKIERELLEISKQVGIKAKNEELKGVKWFYLLKTYSKRRSSPRRLRVGISVTCNGTKRGRFPTL